MNWRFTGVSKGEPGGIRTLDPRIKSQVRGVRGGPYRVVISVNLTELSTAARQLPWLSTGLAVSVAVNSRT